MTWSLELWHFSISCFAHLATLQNRCNLDKWFFVFLFSRKGRLRIESKVSYVVIGKAARQVYFRNWCTKQLISPPSSLSVWATELPITSHGCLWTGNHNTECMIARLIPAQTSTRGGHQVHNSFLYCPFTTSTFNINLFKSSMWEGLIREDCFTDLPLLISPAELILCLHLCAWQYQRETRHMPRIGDLCVEEITRD